MASSINTSIIERSRAPLEFGSLVRPSKWSNLRGKRSRATSIGEMKILPGTIAMPIHLVSKSEGEGDGEILGPDVKIVTSGRRSISVDSSILVCCFFNLFSLHLVLRWLRISLIRCCCFWSWIHGFNEGICVSGAAELAGAAFEARAELSESHSSSWRSLRCCSRLRSLPLLLQVCDLWFFSFFNFFFNF